MPAKKTQEQFITSCRNVWGDKYDLSQIEYKGWNDKIKVIEIKYDEDIAQRLSQELKV